MATVVLVEDGVVEIAKVAEVLPAGTVTAAGTVARDFFALDRLTSTPPEGAAAVSFTVPTDEPPAVTADGLSASDESLGAAGGGGGGGGGGGWGAGLAVSAAVLLAPP